MNIRPDGVRNPNIELEQKQTETKKGDQVSQPASNQFSKLKEEQTDSMLLKIVCS